MTRNQIANFATVTKRLSQRSENSNEQSTRTAQRYQKISRPALWRWTHLLGHRCQDAQHYRRGRRERQRQDDAGMTAAWLFRRPRKAKCSTMGARSWKHMTQAQSVGIFRSDVQAIFQDPFGVYNPFYKVDHVFTEPIAKFKLANSRGRSAQADRRRAGDRGLAPRRDAGALSAPVERRSTAAGRWWRAPCCSNRS